MTTSLPKDALALLKRLGVTDSAYASAGLTARSPITGETVAKPAVPTSGQQAADKPVPN